MKKNLFNGLLVLAVASVGMGTFSSCKDDNGDQLSIVESKIDQLEAELSELKNCKGYCEQARKELEARLVALIEKYKAELDSNLADHEQRIKALEDEIKEINKSIASINTSITEFGNRIAELEAFKDKFSVLDPDAVNTFMQEHNLATNSTITNILNDIQVIQNNYVNKTDFEALQTIVNNLSGEVGNLSSTVQNLQNQFAELDKKVQDGVNAWAWINANKGRIDNLEKADQDLLALINKNTADILTNKEEIAKLKEQMSAIEVNVNNNTNLISALQGDVETINQNISDMKSEFAALQDRVAANEAAIQALKQDIDKLFGLTDRLNKLVTGIINQATTNPVFGTFNLPINVRNNMLITYFGSASHSYTFPSYSSAAEYNGEMVLTTKDIEMLQASGNFKQFSMTEGDVLMDTEDGNAGMVFMTINPNNVDFTGINLSMVNSQDVESGMKLKNLKRSDKELTFGISRAANNGFYEAQATIDPAHVNDVAVKIEPGLKSAFKNALENRGKKDFAQLAKVLYNQVTDILPANGLKAAWTAPDGSGNIKEYAVYSNYDIAATAISPLSFKFMEGTSVNHRLPVITPLSEFKLDKSKLTFDIDVPPFHVNDIELHFSLDHVNITEAGDIFVTIKVPVEVDPETGKVIKEKDVTVNLKEDIDKVLAQIEKDLNGTIDDWNYNIEHDFKEALEKLSRDIEKQVDDMMNNVMGQIDSQLGNMIDEINKEVNDAIGGYINDANKIINKYNELANKINEILENPNSYLQSMACYKGTDGDFHQLSNSFNMPSPFKLAGGNAIAIYMTTYNAEIVVPSYKKFIAVTNVWNVATGKSAQDGDAEAKQLLIEANNQQYMNQPLTGKQHRVAFTANKAGFKYEIVYSALDYRGWTSTRKYYVEVK